MTDKEMLTRELEFLLPRPTDHPNWLEYATWKAGEYARRWPFLYAELPGLLAKATDTATTAPKSSP